MLPQLREVASLNGGVFLRSQALSAGYTGREVRILVESGLWTVLRHGIYVDSVHAIGASTQELMLLQIAAARLSFVHPSVGSHESAAVAYGLPLIHPAECLHLSSSVRGRRGTIPSRILVHRADLPADHCLSVGGVPLTTQARTVIDLSTGLPFDAAVAAADAALHRRLVTAEQLRSVAADLADPAAALKVIAFAQAASQSPLESISRVALAAQGIEAPVLQHKIRDASGRVIAEVDFWWAPYQVAGEADGLVKYDPANGPALRKEKLREEAIGEAGARVVRWTWEQITVAPAQVAERLRRAFALAGR
jgi:hypothetical protein